MPGAFASSNRINWYGFEKGAALGEATGKKIFLHFYADWCAACMKMAKETFKDESVVSYLNKNFIPIKVDADREKQTASTYKVENLPATWFIAEKRQNIGFLTGYVSSDSLIKLLKYIHTESYNRMSFKNFLERK
ncbi:thioredoxin family protein [Thermodesulfobacteriota bacterium]